MVAEMNANDETAVLPIAGRLTRVWRVRIEQVVRAGDPVEAIEAARRGQGTETEVEVMSV